MRTSLREMKRKSGLTFPGALVWEVKPTSQGTGQGAGAGAAQFPPVVMLGPRVSLSALGRLVRVFACE